MKNKRILVLGVALVLFALVVGVAFADFGFIKGVRYENVILNNKPYIQLYNSNDYTVRVYIEYIYDSFAELAPGELKNVAASRRDAYIKNVVKW